MAWIKFQHITDEMYIWKRYNDIKTAIEEMHEKTKQKLYELEYIYWISYSIWQPYFIDWNSPEDSAFNRLWIKRNQYRYDISIHKDKTNRKITRNKIYWIMNWIYCTSYDKT